MKRVLVVGCSGAGKSTLSRRLARCCGVPYVDTDAMYWREHWQPVPADEVVRLLPLASEGWVIDGNFADFRDQVWRRADCVVWLNYSRWRVMGRVLRRNLGWWATRERVWSGNVITLRRVVSGLRFAWRRHGRIRATYPGFLRGLDGGVVCVFRTPAACEAWVRGLEETGAKDA